MKKVSKRRALRYGTVSLLLCLTVVICVVVLNVIASALCLRYDWMYVEMSSPAVYKISDACHDYIEKYVIPEIDKSKSQGKDSYLQILLCDGGTENAQEDNYKYVYDSLQELCGMFEGYIRIDHLNIWEHPSLAKSYDVNSSEDIVCIFNGKHETVSVDDFYITETNGSTVNYTAYNGEKIIASCFMSVTQEDTPVCYLTINHGEVYEDYEFVRIITEAGYSVGTLDMYTDGIPEDCDLLVTYNPKKDFSVKNEVSNESEIEMLEEYMSLGGKYMIFLSPDTFASGGFENLEGFLSSWGVEYMHETNNDGIEACSIVKDSANSLTADGYTLLAKSADNRIMSAIPASSLKNSFGSTTYMSVSEGFSPNGQAYVSSDGKRELYPMFLARNTAVAWADGKAVARASEEDFILMSLCEQDCDNGEKSYLLASASTDFASEDAMQSAVLGNSRVMTELFKYMGKENAPTSMVFKPFEQTEIQSLTSRNANIITVVMTAIPAFAVSVTGGVILIRRKNK